MHLVSYEVDRIIIPMLIVVSLSAIVEFFSKEEVTAIFYLFYIIFCLISPILFLGIPLVLYDMFFMRKQKLIIIAFIPWIINCKEYTIGINFFFVIVVIISFILKYKAEKYKHLHEEYIKKRDELMEVSLNLEKRVNDLMGREDFQVNLATLNERNRIAREIHDNVGHLLTRSILQIGAVMAITKEEPTQRMLINIKSTLDEGMNSIRNSVHNLHEDSIDLYVQLTNIVEDFTFCEAVLNYEINSELKVKVKYDIVSIVKEALANVIKHSNASRVTISLYEHPKLFQLIILDNGSQIKIKSNTGMGLEGIRSRVNALGGIINFDNSKGFKIFISFMKEE